MPLFGMIPVVTLFSKSVEAVVAAETVAVAMFVVFSFIV